MKTHNFYCCYLLRSLQPGHSDSVYIGSTPNPLKRLRQHNGEIKGGAKKTIKKRPWEIILVVHGFPSRLGALQFEWAWQNPHKSRHVRGYKGTLSEKKLNGKIRVLEDLIRAEYYERWPLHVHYVNKLYRNCVKLTSRMNATHGSMEEFILNYSATNTPPTEAACFECLELLTPSNTLICKMCKASYHILCLSSKFLVGEQAQLLPISGPCSSCNSTLEWGQLIKSIEIDKSSKHKTVKPDEPEIIEISDSSDQEFETVDLVQSLSEISLKCTI